MFSRAEIVSALALMVSIGGLILSFLSFRKASKLDNPNAWYDIRAVVDISNCWVLSVHMRNPTRYPLKIDAISVPITSVPLTDKQDFLLGDVTWTDNESEGGEQKKVIVGTERHLKSVCDTKASTIAPESEGVVEKLLFRGRLSAATHVRIEIFYSLMRETHVYKTHVLRVQIPSSGITLQISHV